MNDSLTIEEYLRGCVAYEIADNALATIFAKRGVSRDDAVASLSEKEIDLCTADLYMWCASTPSAKNNTEDSDGGWKHTEGGFQTSAYDKRLLRAVAKDLYSKWEEATTGQVHARIISYGVTGVGYEYD